MGGGRCSAVDCSFVGAGRYCSPRFPGNCRFGASRWCGAGAAPYTAATSAGVRSWGADLAVPDDEGPAAQPAAAASAAAVVGGFNSSATRWPAGNVDVSGGGESVPRPCTGADAGRPSFGGDVLAGRVAFIALPGMGNRGGGARSRRLVEPSRPLRGRSSRRDGIMSNASRRLEISSRRTDQRSRHMNFCLSLASETVTFRNQGKLSCNSSAINGSAARKPFGAATSARADGRSGRTSAAPRDRRQ